MHMRLGLMPHVNRALIGGLALVVGLMHAGCGGSGSPATQPTPTPPAPAVTTGIVVDSLAATPISGVQISVDGIGVVTSGGDGAFTVLAPAPQSLHQATLTSTDTVQRTTHLNLPGGNA